MGDSWSLMLPSKLRSPFESNDYLFSFSRQRNLFKSISSFSANPHYPLCTWEFASAPSSSAGVMPSPVNHTSISSVFSSGWAQRIPRALWLSQALPGKGHISPSAIRSPKYPEGFYPPAFLTWPEEKAEQDQFSGTHQHLNYLCLFLSLFILP